MIKRTITIPAIPGLEIDNTDNDVVIDLEDLNEHEHYGFGWDEQVMAPQYRYTLKLPTGAKIVLEPWVIRKFEHAYKLTEKIELEEGKIYLVADRRKPNDKWLALCTHNLKMDELVVEPIRGGGYPSFEESTKHNYTFYKEFDLDLKEYL